MKIHLIIYHTDILLQLKDYVHKNKNVNQASMWSSKWSDTSPIFLLNTAFIKMHKEQWQLYHPSMSCYMGEGGKRENGKEKC